MAKIPERMSRRRRLKYAPAVTLPPIEKISEPKFKQRLLSRFFVRFHMTLMLGGVTISGVGASKLLLELDVNWMLIRYPIAVCAAYGIFFFSIKVWLWYIGLGSRKKDDPEDESEFDEEYDFDSEPADFSSRESGAARRIEYGDWAGSVFKATWIPFAVVLALAIGFGWAAQHYCPAATKAAEIFYLCR